MCSNAFKLDARMKKYEVMTAYLKWDRDIKLQRHQLRIKNIKPAIDNKSPDRGPFLSLNVKKMRLQEGLQSQALEVCFGFLTYVCKELVINVVMISYVKFRKKFGVVYQSGFAK